MFLELLNDLFMSSSILYFYFGILIMTIGFHQLLLLQQNSWKAQANFHLDDHRYLKVDGPSFEMLASANEPYIIWFVKSFKRIDKPDDDQEDDSTSYFTKSFKIRGGQQWKKTTYSQPYGNTRFYY